MANENLDAFLKGGSEPAPVAETPAPEPVAQESEPKAPEPAPKPENDDDESLPVAAEGEPVVPRRALEDERHKRQDWKEKATRAEVERDMLAKQIEELKKAPPPQPTAPPADVALNLPNPNEDPAGYAQAVIQAAEYKAWLVNVHTHLNNSERGLRAKIGKDAVEKFKTEVKPELDRNPALNQEFLAQDDPYTWLHERFEAVRMMREVNMDPAAYKARLRAEWEADAAKPQAAPVSPVANLPPSLANVRSAAARGAPAFSGPPALSDIFGPAGAKR